MKSSVLACIVAVASAAPQQFSLGLPALGTFKAASDADANPRFDHDKLVQVCGQDVYSLIQEHDLDVWSGDGKNCWSVHVPHRVFSHFEELFLVPGVSVTVLNDNIQADIDAEKQRSWFQEYHTYDDIKQWYKSLVDSNKHLMRFVPSIGQSHEGRDLFAVHVTSDKNKGHKKQIYWQGQIHAREWLSGTTVQYLTHQFVNQYGKNQTVTDLLDQNELVIVPIVNPDGYVYSWGGNRLWRKNRRKNPMNSYGVDLNRNFDVNWGMDGGASRSPWSETFKGPSAASEPEVQAVTNYFLQQKNVVAGIDFHTFSQLVLRPWGHSNENPPHFEQLKRVGDGIRDYIYSVHGKSYTSQPSIGLYPTTGTANDWFYSDEVLEKVGRRAYGYTIELRPRSMFEGGFVMDPKYIIPTGEELYEAMVYFVRETSANPLD